MALKTTAEFKDKALRKFLNKIADNLLVTSKAANRYVNFVGPVALKDVDKHFEDEKGPGGSWRSWSSSYTEHMIKIGKSGNLILQDSGSLRSQNKIAISPKRSGGRLALVINNATTKSGFPYAFAHDTGGPKLPQREFMWLSPKALENIARATLKFIERTS